MPVRPHQVDRVADYLRELLRDWKAAKVAKGERPIVSDLARKAGLTPSQFTALEQGTKGVTAITRGRFAKAFDLSEDELVAAAFARETQPSPEEIGGALLEAATMLKGLGQATDAELRAVLAPFRVELLRDRDLAFWTNLLLQEVAAYRARTNPQHRALTRKVNEKRKAEKEAPPKSQPAPAKRHHKAS